MTAYTSAGSGKFNTNATWVGGAGHPSADGDTFVISAGHLVEFDADTSGLTSGFGASSVAATGQLYFSRTAGTYYLKMNAALTISATSGLDASDGSGGAYPNTCFATVKFAAGFGMTGSGSLNLFPTAPTHAFCKLTSGASAAATVLNVDTDLTVAGDSFIWANARIVRVDDINQAQESEAYSISSVSATQITLTAGLSNAKSTGAYVILTSGNVEVVGAGSASGVAVATSSGKGGVLRDFLTGISGSGNTATTISGCGNGISGSGNTATTISGCTNGVNGNGNTVTTISGCGTGVSGNGGIVTTISGCSTAISGNGGIVTTISGCTTGISGSANRASALTSNTRDLNTVESAQFFNCLMASATEFLNYNSSARSIKSYVESLDHDQVAGAFRAWTRGGITSSVASPVYDNRVRSYNAVCESASAYAFWQRTVLVPAYGSINVAVAVQKDASMAYLPNVQIFPNSVEPLISGSATLTLTMTNSTNTWEVLEGTVTNNTDASVLYTIRMLAKNATGNVYWSPVIRVSGMMFPMSLEAGMVA